MAFIYIVELALIAVLATAAMLVTLAAAMLVRKARLSSILPRSTFVLVGSCVPLSMLAYGLYLAWPWPWIQPQAMRDGIAPGPWLLLAGVPALPICLVSPARS